jgi:hypothetical protein
MFSGSYIAEFIDILQNVTELRHQVAVNRVLHKGRR